jgi:hypothetical protein
VEKVSTALKPKENCQGCSSVCPKKIADVNKNNAKKLWSICFFIG